MTALDKQLARAEGNRASKAKRGQPSPEWVGKPKPSHPWRDKLGSVLRSTRKQGGAK
jgi:hypothetical protein